MKPLHLILISLVLCGLVIGGVHADTTEYYTSTISASSAYDVQYATLAIDNNSGTYWSSNYDVYPLPANPAFLVMDFGGSPPMITNYTVQARAIAAGYPTTLFLFGSNDNSTYTFLDNRTGLTWSAGQTKTFNLFFQSVNQTKYRYYKLYVTASPDSYVSIAEVHLYGTSPILAAFNSTNISVATNSTSRGWEGTTPFSMQFTNTSSSPPHTSLVWNATNVTGNNEPFTFNSTAYYNPIYTFTKYGNYSIQLNVTGTFGTNISTQITFVNVSEPIPVASFTANVTTGYFPLAVQFTDTSTNIPTSWVWWFRNVTGNNTEVQFSTSQNPLHTFGIGNYTTKLKATNTGGSGNSSLTWINVSLGIPTAAFNANVTTGVNPMMVMFNDTSTGPGITSYNTTFGDNSWTNQTTFPSTNITHSYSSAGIYTVGWYVTNLYGTASATLNITVYGSACSNFSLFNTAGNTPFTTYLYDTSTNTTPGPATYYWMFGDGNTSTSEYLYFTWNATGTYSINHSFNNGLSTSWNNKSAYITAGNPITAPVASFYGGPQIGAPPLQVFFTDVSINTPTSWLWVFGDGNTTDNTLQNPSHLYEGSGFFTVNLTATNSEGSNKTSESNFVTVY